MPPDHIAPTPSLTRTDAELLHGAILDLTSAVKDLRHHVESTYVRKDVLVPTLKALDDDVRGVQEWITWATRIVLALVIAAIVGLVLTTGGGK